jgi:hypothetical protein
VRKGLENASFLQATRSSVLASFVVGSVAYGTGKAAEINFQTSGSKFRNAADYADRTSSTSPCLADFEDVVGIIRQSAL